MQSVKIDDKWYHDVPDEVVQQMQSYYDTMLKAVRKTERLTQLATNVRCLQKEYFKNRDQGVLRRSKHEEQLLDEYLAGKEPNAAKAQQAELFR